MKKYKSLEGVIKGLYEAKKLTPEEEHAKKVALHKEAAVSFLAHSKAAAADKAASYLEKYEFHVAKLKALGVHEDVEEIKRLIEEEKK